MNLDKIKVMFNEHFVPGLISPSKLCRIMSTLARLFNWAGTTLKGRLTGQFGWAGQHSASFFGSLRRASAIPQCLKMKVFEHCVLPVMMYGAETWTMTAELVHKYKVAQRAME